MSNFAFLRNEWPEVYASANRAEALATDDPRAACFYARRTLELLVHWLYKYDANLRLPYQDNLSALLHEPTFRQVAGEAVFNKARVIVTLGNRAVHHHRPIPGGDALTALKELYHIGHWLVYTYATGPKPAPAQAFDPAVLPRPAAAAAPQSAAQLQKLSAELATRDEKLVTLLADKAALDAELVKLRAEVAAAKQANASRPDTHDYSEAETRDTFIDLLLKEAGWPLDQPRDREYEVTGMPNKQGTGYVDYVLWGDDGKPLGLVEAKRTKRDARVGQQQAKLYADSLEQRFGQRPVIFYTNGYEHWIWDDRSYPPRAVQGFYKKTELELLIQRRSMRKKLADAPINEDIVARHYQTRAIRRMGEAFEQDNDRKALIVMATGAGKTRTVIALCDLLIRCNWVKRVLFLADRVALVNQAANAFKRHLPNSAPVNLVTEKSTEGRVFLSTYPTMMGLIEESQDGQRRFGSGHFDLLIIDEAHRSVFVKYRAIFDYFDSLLVGLTATPKDELDRNTYSLFNLQNGVPTDFYPLEEAVADKFLVPPKAVAVPLQFQREGISYDELSEEEKEQWDALDWDEDGGVPNRVEAQAVNKWLFNEDTVDKVLMHLMTRGQKVAGGDRLGKTIIFAKNTDHAEYIAARFNANYPNYKGEFARVITFKTEYAQSLIDAFSIKDKAPHIAISVDMLDTGIDVPEVVNLVFFKLVRSKTKFWQMVGRGTRTCHDLFDPGQDKQFFYLFDYCQNLEYFSQNPESTDGAVAESLAKKLFLTRLDLIAELDKATEDALGPKAGEDADHHLGLRNDLTAMLQTDVGAMNTDNFVVRPHRRQVEKYRQKESWVNLGVEERQELAHHVAGLPTTQDPEDEEAKRFDLLILNLQLSLLRSEPNFTRLRDQVVNLAEALEEQSAIPIIQGQMVLIQEIQTEDWWEHVTLGMLETTRRRLRDLIKLIEKTRRKPIYTNFEDEMGLEADYQLPGFAGLGDFERFREKARVFLRQHENHIAVHKLRMNEPLTPADLAELERMLAEAGLGSHQDIERAKQESAGLGLFVRELVGLDRSAAKLALNTYLSGRTPSAAQIEFINLIIDHLTERGVMKAERLYESPFTDIAPHGPDGLFAPADVEQLISILVDVSAKAGA
ncbi:MAG: DEAD/DEAH box helicase family protein [Opitutaceae bacterium]|nr:DEAD/DEAH box helicase family protein [Opitutaceae bacterium]